jgi:hypothetical protein
MAARIAMMAITTSSSINVNPLRLARIAVFLILRCESARVSDRSDAGRAWVGSDWIGYRGAAAPGLAPGMPFLKRLLRRYVARRRFNQALGGLSPRLRRGTPAWHPWSARSEKPSRATAPMMMPAIAAGLTCFFTVFTSFPVKWKRGRHPATKQ